MSPLVEPFVLIPGYNHCVNCFVLRKRQREALCSHNQSLPLALVSLVLPPDSSDALVAKDQQMGAEKTLPTLSEWGRSP